MGRSLELSDGARAVALELLAYAARVDGPLTLREVAALDGAARGLGVPGRAPRPDALRPDDGGLLPPPLDGLSALECRVAFGAAAWMVYADGAASFIERAFLDFVAEEGGLGPGEVRALVALAERARRECGPHMPPSLEFELLVLEVGYLYALTRAKLSPAPSSDRMTAPPRAPGPAGATSGVEDAGLRRAS
jgi:hypothetical protein